MSTLTFLESPSAFFPVFYFLSPDGTKSWRVSWEQLCRYGFYLVPTSVAWFSVQGNYTRLCISLSYRPQRSKVFH